jgi:hypothetical protein
MITAAVSDAEIRACHPVMRQLRPHWSGPDAFVTRIRLQQDEGYKLAWGRYLYVDDPV